MNDLQKKKNAVNAKNKHVWCVMCRVSKNSFKKCESNYQLRRRKDFRCCKEKQKHINFNEKKYKKHQKDIPPYEQ